MTIFSVRSQVQAFRWVVFILALCAAATFLPLWAPLVLAAWVAVLVRPLLLRVAKATGGRHRAAGALVVLLVMAIFVPLGVAIASLSRGVVDLGHAVLDSGSTKSALIAVVSGGQPGAPDSIGDALDVLKSPGKIGGLIEKHGIAAVQFVGGVAGAAAAAAVGLFVFFYAVYVFLVDGASYYGWLEEHAPIDVNQTRRLAAAFNETGRGLFVGIGLTGLSQGFVATITYFALGVPRALVLGLLTCVASLLPSVGTTLVWIPIAVGLVFVGKTVSAAIMVGIGVFGIGTIDNLLRPIFARFGKLELSTFVLLTSIFGGLGVFGAWGILLGPLFARLAKEALTIAREWHSAGTS
jgi:predicted PurR-regulated permease PerM